MSEGVERYRWSFTIKDVVNFEGTQIIVYTNTYEEAIKKIRTLKLPQLKSYGNVEEALKLVEVYEVQEDLEDPDISMEDVMKDDDE